jgi:putative aldouronate transport system substrate-binding protein
VAIGATIAACAPAAPTAAPKATEKPADKAAATAAPKATEVAKAKSAEELLGKELMPGSPDHNKGWKTTLPDFPVGMPLTPPIVITQSLRVDAATKFSKGDDINNSQVSRFLKKAFGIEYKCPWTWVLADERAQKYNTAMASGDLPDICSQVPASIFAQMLEANMVQDYTETYEAVVSKELKEAMEWGDHSLWAYVEVNGRKMAWPTIEMAAQNDKVLWYRKDWLEKVGMAVPKTVDEVAQVALAFKKGDLGQGAKGTTVGLLANNTLSAWYGGVDPIIGAFGVQPAYHDTPGYFTDDGKGGLQYDGIRPEMKEALLYLRKWFTDGVLSKDFFTLQVMDSAKLIAGNNCGLMFSPSNYGVLF